MRRIFTAGISLLERAVHLVNPETMELLGNCYIWGKSHYARKKQLFCTNAKIIDLPVFMSFNVYLDPHVKL
jgi:hypothetical protein